MNNSPYWIYVMELENKKYYVGYTANVVNRMNAHKTGKGSKWTMLHKPIKVIYELNLEDANYKEIERYITLSMMALLGWENVRGGGWCQIILNSPPVELR